MQNNTKQGQTSRILAFASVGILAVAILGAALLYNQIKAHLQEVKINTQIAWSLVEGSYQRQADFIPFMAQQMAPFVKEKVIVESALKVFNEKGKRIVLENQEHLPQFEKTQIELGVAVNNLLALMENDPKLKNIRQLNEARVLLSEVRRKISDERKNYSEANQKYNQVIQKFPNSIIAPTVGAYPRPYFSADAPSLVDNVFK